MKKKNTKPEVELYDVTRDSLGKENEGKDGERYVPGDFISPLVAREKYYHVVTKRYIVSWLWEVFLFSHRRIKLRAKQR